MPHPGKILIRALARAAAHSIQEGLHQCEPPPKAGAHASYIPNVLVRTHDNQIARFYDDLVRSRIVLINCMAVRDQASCCHIETVSQVQPLIGEELGRSVFIYSITTDPEHDTTSLLRAFAEKYGAGKGWLFLTGEPADLKMLRARLFNHMGGEDCSMHLFRYGNEAVGLWGGIPAKSTPELIAQRLSWITPQERQTGPPKRGGPPPLLTVEG